MSRIDWMDDALCAEVGTEIFFPENGANPNPALQVCRRCPVRQDCLEHALTLDAAGPTRVTGIWGGTTLSQRQKMKGAAYRRLAS